ncbi:AEC family transporter [Thalassospira lucentensis]|uniref:AEC family transporter n=1 Tax=Thalassospira lucentensis TaxID=168935 RepID=UPI003D2EE82D
MLDILAITTPIFLIIAIGYFAVYRNIVPQTIVRGMGAFVLNFALPCLLIRALAQRDLTEIIDPIFLLAYGSGSLLVFALGFSYALLIAKKSQPNATLQGLGMSMSNSGFVGYPVASQLLGPAAEIALALCVIIENLIMMPMVLVLGDSAKNEDESRWQVLSKALGNLGKNPIIIAIMIGLVISLSGITLPRPIFKAIDMLASASGPVALFVIGGGLVGLRLKGMRADMARIVSAKLILHPLAIFALIYFMPDIDPMLQIACVSFACSPMLSIYPIFGQRYGHEGLCAASLMMATSMSFLTISTALWLLDTTQVFGPLP